MKKKWIAAVIIYIALIAACLIVIYAVPSVKGMLEKTYVTEYGEIDITDEVTGYIVRDETVYTAAQDSEVSRVADTDVLLKAHTSVVELTPIVDEKAEAAKEAGPDASQDEAEAAAEANGEAPDNISRKYVRLMESLGDSVIETESGRSQAAGYISYNIDGAEARFSTDKLGDLSQADYETLDRLRSVETPDRKCGKGDPLFKVISNRRWYLVFYIDKDAGSKYYEGRTVSIDINGENVPVKVYSVQEGTATTKVTLSCKSFFEGFTSERVMKTTVTAASAQGLMLQDSSIVMKADQPGVFVKNKLGEHKFKPISVIADDGERCVAYSDIYVDADGNYVETIKTYDEIVAEPTEEEIADLQVQAEKEAKEKAKKEAEEKAKKEAEEKARAEEAARLKAEAEAAKAEAEQAEAAAQAAAEKASEAEAAAQAANVPGAEGTPAPEPAEE